MLILLVVVLAAAGAGVLLRLRGLRRGRGGGARAPARCSPSTRSRSTWPAAATSRSASPCSSPRRAAPAHEGGLDGSKATDLVISTFSQANPADVTGARDALKQALKKKIIEAYDGEVMDIYYNQYVTQ